VLCIPKLHEAQKNEITPNYSADHYETEEKEAMRREF
jgi:hypothetical protein